MNSPSPQLLVAITLGSNSFHMVAANLEGDRIVKGDHWQQTVRLADGVSDEQRLSASAFERGLHCLAGFSDALRKLKPVAVAAVGTGVLRHAANAGEFIDSASRVLGVPVKVLSGRDEGFLVYVGVAQTLGVPDDNSLVMDLGGGSTEFIVGRKRTLLHLSSLDIGCVDVSQRFFSDGFVTEPALTAAEAELRHRLAVETRALRDVGWSHAIGTGGTILSVGAVIQRHRLGGTALTGNGLMRLRQRLLEAGRADEIAEGVLSPERIQVLPGGFAVLSAIFDVLGLERMAMSGGALREGVLVQTARQIVAQQRGAAASP